MSLVYDKSDQHQTIYDSYDTELVSKLIQSLTIQNLATCNGCSAAPLTQYRNNKIYQEIVKEDIYFKDDNDEMMYIDIRRSKGYLDELVTLTRNDSDVSIIVN